jgi:hypothetical protein
LTLIGKRQIFVDLAYILNIVQVLICLNHLT